MVSDIQEQNASADRSIYEVICVSSENPSNKLQDRESAVYDSTSTFGFHCGRSGDGEQAQNVAKMLMDPQKFNTTLSYSCEG